jgi:CubicO group peptidase (beta-lactamase class C family)
LGTVLSRAFEEAAMRALIATILVLPVGFITPVHGRQSESLQPGRTVEATLEANGSRRYSLQLPVNRFVYGELDEGEVQSVITVFNPSGQEIGRFNTYGPLERFHIESVAAGTYRIRVSAARGNGGTFSLRIAPSEVLGRTSAERTTQLLKAYYRAKEPGGTVTILRRGEVVYSGSIGLANLTHGVPFSSATPANIGSISKQFTAFAVALLEQQGALSVSDDVRQYLPYLRDYGTPVRLVHLLNHTSGYREIFRTFPMKGVRGLWLREELIASAQRQLQLQSPPGAEYRYSNTGYLLLAEVIERVTHMPFPKWMKLHVFDPLGMKNTMISTRPGQVIPGSAQGYRRSGQEFSQEQDTSAFYGASSIYSTAGDVARWLRNFSDAAVGGRELISRMTVGPAPFNDSSQYSFGLEIGRHRGLLQYSHGAYDGGIRAEMTYYPQIDGGVILLFNAQIWPALTEEITEDFFGAYLKEPDGVEPVTAAGGAETPVDAALLANYVGRYGGGGEHPLIVSLVQAGSRLKAEFTDPGLPPSVPLRALSVNRFTGEDIDVTVTFHPETDGTNSRLTFRWQGRDLALGRLPPWKPSGHEIRSYAGLYYSPELETVYTIAAEDTQLKVKYPLAQLNLTPEAPDSFVCPWLGEYRFNRNEHGEVSSFVVEGVTFEKLR